MITTEINPPSPAYEPLQRHLLSRAVQGLSIRVQGLGFRV